jgi:hypothetical protein
MVPIRSSSLHKSSLLGFNAKLQNTSGEEAVEDLDKWSMVIGSYTRMNASRFQLRRHYIGRAEGHGYPDLQVGEEVNPRPAFMFL